MLFKEALVLVSIVLCASAENTSLATRSLARNFITYEKCKIPGHSCRDCETVNYCYDLAPGQSIEDFEVCKKDNTCKDGLCTTDENLMCHSSVREWEFECFSKGFFPHPYDCKKYYMCTMGEDLTYKKEEFECEGGFGYDSLSTICHLKLDKGKCPSPVRVCSALGNNGPIFGNPYLYYTCLPKEGSSTPIAKILRCDNGKHYTGIGLDFCTDEAPELDADGNCVKTQNYYDDSCINYTKCEETLPPTKASCELGEKFDPYTRLCEPSC